MNRPVTNRHAIDRPLPVREPAGRGAGRVIRIICPACGRELASATHSPGEMKMLHDPFCRGGTQPDPGRERA